jgi:AP-3 complex subunit sigma
MIYAFFVLNEHGEIRLARSYVEMTQGDRTRLAHEIFRLISARDPTRANIVPGDAITSVAFPRRVSLVYRAHAGLLVATIIDDAESALSMLDLTQTFVQVLNGCFKDASDAHIAFNPDKALQALDALINGGLVFETQGELALARIAEENAADKRFGIKMNLQASH